MNNPVTVTQPRGTPNPRSRADSARAATFVEWVHATRPKTLPAAIAPVLVGVACAAAVGSLRVIPSLAALACALLIQIAANFANDVFDHEKGADTPDRVGPTRAVAAGLISGRAMKRALWLTLAGATLIGIYLVSLAGWPVLLLGAASMILAVAYTGGPYPLGYHGLGDITVLTLFGFMAVCGTVYVNAGSVPALAWFAALPMGTLSTAILVVNNVRDITTDERAGKRTLAVRFGRDVGLVEYRLLFALAFLTPPTMVLLGILDWPGLLPLLALPKAFKLQAELASLRGAQLNETLARTAQLLLLFGALFGAGIVASAQLSPLR